MSRQPQAGYSGTPLPRKLGISAGSRVLVQGVPDRWDQAVLMPPGGAILHGGAPRDEPYDVVVAFCPDLRVLGAYLDPTRADLTSALTGAGRLWLCWPKKSSGVATDVTEAAVREQGLATGLVDIKICAVDQTWSGLCFVRRRADRTSTGRARSA